MCRIEIWAVILAGEGETGRITLHYSEGKEIMLHLYPDPDGPVRIDPQPLTFSRSSECSQPTLSCAVCWWVFIFLCCLRTSPSAAAC